MYVCKACNKNCSIEITHFDQTCSDCVASLSARSLKFVSSAMNVTDILEVGRVSPTKSRTPQKGIQYVNGSAVAQYVEHS